MGRRASRINTTVLFQKDNYLYVGRCSSAQTTHAHLVPHQRYPSGWVAVFLWYADRKTDGREGRRRDQEGRGGEEGRRTVYLVRRRVRGSWMGHLASTPPFSRVDTDKWNGEGQMTAIGSLRHPPKSLGVNTTPLCCSFSPTQCDDERDDGVQTSRKQP